MIDKAEKREILQRLKTAQKRSLEAFEEANIIPDLHPGTNLANIWIFMAAGYSGLEQSLKFLIATEKETTIEKLLKDKAYRTHDLRILFSNISSGAQQILSEYYSRYQVFAQLH